MHKIQHDSLDILIKELSESTIERREEILTALVRLRDFDAKDVSNLSEESTEIYVLSCQLVDVAIAYVMKHYDSNSDMVEHARQVYRLCFYVYHEIQKSSQN